MLKELKYHYDENCIFFNKAILKHKQVACMRRKLPFTFSNFSLCSRYIQVFKICKLAKWWRHALNQILIKYDEKRYILANLYRKSLILCTKILLNVLHNLSLTVLLPWQHTGFQTSPILKAFLATFGMPFSYLQICKWCLIYMIQQAYKYVSLSCGLV